MKTPHQQLTLCLILACACLPGAAGQAANEQPNILFIFSDDHVDKAISCYRRPDGHGNLTPNIDRLADAGSVFLRSYCANSICKPSRASVLTGTHSHINGVVGNGSRFLPDQVFFPKLLREHGYQTTWIGKWHLKDEPGDMFDHWSFNGGHGQGSYYNPDFTSIDGSEERVEGYCTDITTNKIIQWIESRESGKPFFAACAFKSPHTDPIPPVRKLPNFLAYLDSFKIPETYHGAADHVPPSLKGRTTPYHYREGNHSKFIPPAGSYGEITPEGIAKDSGLKTLVRMTGAERKEWHKHLDPVNAEWRRRKAAGEIPDRELSEIGCLRYAAAYLACVDAIDENVGRLLDCLEKEGLAENTVVIYSSDQGYFLGEHGFNDKRKAYEPGMTMPFIIRWPGQVKPGTRHKALIQNIDYGPTFLTMAGVPVPERMQGLPLQPLFDGTTPENWRKSLYYHYYDASPGMPYMEAVTTDRYRLMRCYGPWMEKDEWRLFDLQDPLEVESLYDNPEHAALRAELEKELVRLREQYGHPAEGLPAAVTKGAKAKEEKRKKDKTKQKEKDKKQKN